MIETARLIKQQRNNLAVIEIKKQEKCNGCKACAFGTNDKVKISAVNEIGAKIGDTVEVFVPERDIKSASLWLYIMPLALMIVGILVGLLISELAQLLFAIIFLGIGFVILYFIDRIVYRNKKYLPAIINIVTLTIEEKQGDLE